MPSTPNTYGTLHGREAIRAWITEVMSPFPQMQFSQDWVAFDTDHDAVLLERRSCCRIPRIGSIPASDSDLDALVYAGDGQWSSDQDVYHSARDAGRVIKAWRAAGGELAMAEQVQVQSS